MVPTSPRLIFTTCFPSCAPVRTFAGARGPITGGEDRSEVDARARGAGAAHTTLIDVMRCFSSPQFVEALRSTCRKTIGLAADATGSQLHQARQPVVVSILHTVYIYIYSRWLLAGCSRQSACVSRGRGHSFCRIQSICVTAASPT